MVETPTDPPATPPDPPGTLTNPEIHELAMATVKTLHETIHGNAQTVISVLVDGLAQVVSTAPPHLLTDITEDVVAGFRLLVKGYQRAHFQEPLVIPSRPFDKES